MWRDQPWWLRDARQYGIVIVLLLAVVGAFIAVPDFNTEENVGNVVTQSAALGVLAIGQTFVIVCGLIDLSVGQLQHRNGSLPARGPSAQRFEPFDGNRNQDGEDGTHQPVIAEPSLGQHLPDAAP
jgi:hypothetical protein